ncbi:hypothetical protein FRC03_005042 [Tulasnella sp. 419]|nr:hypothetical protein FRC03_005042 [Tulasnella sp. 419]
MSHLERGDEPNDQLIHFRRSDGDPTARPPADKLNGPSNPGGFVDYMKKVGVNEAPAKLWRQKLGNALRKDLGLSMNKQYYLAGWPRDYELFVHYKGESKAGTLPRNDLYLYGGPSKVYLTFG